MRLMRCSFLRSTNLELSVRMLSRICLRRSSQMRRRLRRRKSLRNGKSSRSSKRRSRQAGSHPSHFRNRVKEKSWIQDASYDSSSLMVLFVPTQSSMAIRINSNSVSPSKTTAGVAHATCIKPSIREIRSLSAKSQREFLSSGKHQTTSSSPAASASQPSSNIATSTARSTSTTLSTMPYDQPKTFLSLTKSPRWAPRLSSTTNQKAREWTSTPFSKTGSGIARSTLVGHKG